MQRGDVDSPLNSETQIRNHKFSWKSQIIFLAKPNTFPGNSQTMSSQSVLRQPSSNRRQPLLNPQASNKGSRLAEVAGGTTAECAAVCCCCPCGLVNLLILALYKVPAGLCRRAMRKKRRQRMTKKGLLPPRRRRCSCGCGETELQSHPVSVDNSSEIKSPGSEDSDKEVEELEKEMWERFYSAGFWRSPSQREEVIS